MDKVRGGEMLCLERKSESPPVYYSGHGQTSWEVCLERKSELPAVCLAMRSAGKTCNITAVQSYGLRGGSNFPGAEDFILGYST